MGTRTRHCAELLSEILSEDPDRSFDAMLLAKKLRTEKSLDVGGGSVCSSLRYLLEQGCVQRVVVDRLYAWQFVRRLEPRPKEERSTSKARETLMGQRGYRGGKVYAK